MKLPDYLISHGIIGTEEFFDFAEASNKLIKKLGIKLQN